MDPLPPKGEAAEGAAGAAGEGPRFTKGEAAEGAAAAGSHGNHRAPQESQRQSRCHQVSEKRMSPGLKQRNMCASHPFMMVHKQHRKEEEQKRKMAIRHRADEDEMNLALRRKLEENRKERESLKQSQTAKAQDTSKPAAFKVTTGQV